MNDWSTGGPAHHCTIGIGQIADKLEKLGAFLGIEVLRVCQADFDLSKDWHPNGLY